MGRDFPLSIEPQRRKEREGRREESEVEYLLRFYRRMARLERDGVVVDQIAI
jgi:hypothetical protein